MLHSNRKGEITSQYYTGTSLILKGGKKWQSNKISSFTDEGKCALTLLKTFRVQSRVTAALATSIAQFPNHGRTTCCPVSQGRLYRLSAFFSKITRRLSCSARSPNACAKDPILVSCLVQTGMNFQTKASEQRK